MSVYSAPSWDAPFDPEAYLALVPTGALIKGFFSTTMVAAARQRGIQLKHAREKYLPFLDYPLIDHNRLVLETAGAFWPELPPRLGLRKVGRAAVQSLMETTFGKALLGGLTQPDTVGRALAALARAYTTTMSKPTPVVEVTATGEQSVVFKLRDAWCFLDSQQVGIIEGVCKACGVRAEVLVATDGPATAEFACSWTSAPSPLSSYP